MRIQITIGDQRFGATLDRQRRSRDLVAQLPVTIDMVDHGGGREDRPAARRRCPWTANPTEQTPTWETSATTPPATTSSSTTATSPTSRAS